jgi:hypothetical protein
VPIYALRNRGSSLGSYDEKMNEEKIMINVEKMDEMSINILNLLGMLYF